MTTVYVPRDSAARSVGADDVAAALQVHADLRSLDITIVRNGTRGLLWLEPLIEVEVSGRRIAYGPVTADDVPSLLDAGLLDVGILDGAPHDLNLGDITQHSYLVEQQRLIFERIGVTDPLSLDDYIAHGGLAGLRRALELSTADIVAEVTASGLRGRGGAGFPAGIKWRTVHDAEADQKYVACNADEGDSGTFADRLVMEDDPYLLLEGMSIAGIAVGATHGYIYIRSEYPDAIDTMNAAISNAREYGWLGPDVLTTGKSFDVEVRAGAGAYICGEETSMLESLEGKRGMVRPKPPLPALVGLFGKPTVVNNVLTLSSVPWIMSHGAAAYASLGVGRSLGTQIWQLAGNIKHGGVVEMPFGVSLRELVEGYGGGTASGRPVRAVQVGGPLGAYVPEQLLDLPMDYEEFAAVGAMVGHGGVVVFDDTVDMLEQARFAMEFCAEESCGKCTPCRVGAVRGVETIDKIAAGTESEANLVVLDDLLELMTDGSLCALGGLTPMPVRSALRHFPEDFHPRQEVPSP